MFSEDFFLSKNKDIKFIQNFTDVDDKIINKAEVEGTTYDIISEQYIKNYFKDFDALNVLAESSKGNRTH